MSQPIGYFRLGRQFAAIGAVMLLFFACGEAADVKNEGAKAPAAPSPTAVSDGQLKFVTTAERVYRVGYETLSPYLGKMGDPRRWALWCVGEPVPVLVKGEEDGRFDRADYVEWFAPTLQTSYNHIVHGSFDNDAQLLVRDAYTTEGVYFLRFGGPETSPPLRLRDAPTTVQLQMRFWHHRVFRRTKHIEYDRIRRNFAPDRGAEYSDNKFWDHVSWSARPFRHHYERLVGLASEADQTCSMTVKLWGYNRPRNPPEHQLEIGVGKTVNGKPVREIIGRPRWEGVREFYFTTTTLSPSLVDEWATEFSFNVVPRESPDMPDVILLDWVRVEYPSFYRADQDWLEFVGPSLPTDLPPPYGGWLNPLILQTFQHKPVWVLDLTSGERQELPLQREWKTAGEKDVRTLLNVYFPLAKTGHRYVAYTPAGVRKPAAVRWVEPDRLRTQKLNAEYLVITHEKFVEQARRLADHRKALGLSSLVVTTDEIANSFHEGFSNIAAIKEFIRLAYTTWDTRPRFVVLVGDASWDDLGIEGSEFANYLPTFYYGPPRGGHHASDNWFACVADDDPYPDLAIGRLPVRSVEEARAYVDKVIEYDTSPAPGDWRDSAMLISSYNQFSHNNLDKIAETYLTSFTVTKCYTDPQTVYDETYATTVTARFDPGYALVVFAGHGGSFVWQVAQNPGGGRALDLFSPKHVAQLTNTGKYPLVLALTCYTNSFDNPLQQTIGESLILEPDKGAIGVVSSSWRGMLGNEFSLARAMLDALIKDPALTVGEALSMAKRQGQIDANTHGVCLLGDPALRVYFDKRANNLPAR